MTIEKPFYIIGTAGHIDHGKTSLIKALTGIETDRLKEEKERGITIDLGFAYFDGPDGRRYGIVDVPGHEKFIPNMLAGAYGFDVVLMVVAADDGVKPQTIEHFEILHLLKVPRAMFVITKIDLVKPERIEEVREEIEILTHDSYLADSKIIAASNSTGEGLKDVAAEISRLVSEEIPRVNHPYFRFPIDRSFTITGFGTVATGTIMTGEVKIDDEMLLVPGHRVLRVRNIEVHDEKVGKASDGQRAAINLSKIEKTEIERGMELVSPKLGGEMHDRYFASLEMLPHRYCNLKNFHRVRLFKGTMETISTIINLESDTFKPKGKYVVQMNFHEEYLILTGDRFIIRDETNRFTIGGGEFIIPAKIKRTRIDQHDLSTLKNYPGMSLPDKISVALHFDKRILVTPDSLSTMFNMENGEIISSISSKSAELEILPWREKTVALKSKLAQFKQLIFNTIEEFHAKNPELPGIDKKSIREMHHDDFSSDDEMEKIWGLLIDDGKIVDGGEFLQLKDFRIEFKGEDAELKRKILEIYSNLSGNTPKRERLPEMLNIDEEKVNRIFHGLVKSREIILLATGVYISKSAFEKVESRVVEYLKQRGEIAVAEFRDMIGTNRNMAVCLLEAMDNRGVTVRKENVRILRKGK